MLLVLKYEIYVTDYRKKAFIFVLLKPKIISLVVIKKLEIYPCEVPVAQKLNSGRREELEKLLPQKSK